MASCFTKEGADNASGLSYALCMTTPSQEEMEFIASRTKPLIQSHPTVAYIYIILMSSALVIGSVGNILILMVVGGMRNMQRTGKVFLVNMAVADICVASIADPMCVVAVVKGEAWFDDKLWLCETVAAMCLTACFCAFLSLTLASINRYVFICHNILYDKFFTTKTCVAACIIAWLTAAFFEFPNFIGWGGHYFDPKNHQCIWDRTASFAYTLFVSVALIYSPLLVMLVCYILIFRHIYRTKLSLHLFDDKDLCRTRKTWMETLRTSRMLLGIFIVFLICWTPYGLIIVYEFFQKLSVEAHLFVTMLAHFHSSANCTVYAITNRNFRISVMRRLGCIIGRTSLSSESDSRSTEISKISHLRNGPHTSSSSSTTALTVD